MLNVDPEIHGALVLALRQEVLSMLGIDRVEASDAFLAMQMPDGEVTAKHVLDSFDWSDPAHDEVALKQIDAYLEEADLRQAPFVALDALVEIAATIGCDYGTLERDVVLEDIRLSIFNEVINRVEFVGDDFRNGERSYLISRLEKLAEPLTGARKESANRRIDSAKQAILEG